MNVSAPLVKIVFINGAVHGFVSAISKMVFKTKKPMSLLISILIISGILLILGLIFIIRPSAENNLNRWAEENKYTIVSKEIRSASESPFSYFSMSRDETFYRVTVQTESGETRRGWVRCAGKFTALLSPPAEAVWDK